MMKLSARSPAALVYFTAGSLPATALLHLRQISLFSMICRLVNDPLHHHARHILLTSSLNKNSWFAQIRKLLQQYELPHPLHLLEQPPEKLKFKKLSKSKVINFWETKLRSESQYLPSLKYFHTQYLSLSTTHRLWTSAGSKPYEVAKARIQLLFLSSQYPCAAVTRHWSSDNPMGHCRAPPCLGLSQFETAEHLLLHCPYYNSIRASLLALCLKLKNPVSHSILLQCLFEPCHVSQT